MAVSDLDAMATLRPETNGIGGFALSHWRDTRDKVGTGYDTFVPAAMFLGTLRRWQGFRYHGEKARADVLADLVRPRASSPQRIAAKRTP